MRGLIRARTFRTLCLLLLALGQAVAILAQTGPPSKDRYIIVLKPPKNGVPELSDHVITTGGGKVEYKVPGLIQVTLPEPAVEAMRKQERVKYIQKVILGPLPNASDPPPLRMTASASSLRATTESTPPTWRSGTYKYDASGNIYAIGVANDETGSTVQHRYAYDELSRLKRADTITTSTHTETFTYDPYGNLTEHNDDGAVTATPVEDSNTNRLAWSASHPYTYDAAGNLTADYNAAYSYDPFSMLREKDYGSKQEFYIYTASDERIGVKYGTAGDSPTIWSIRDFSGNVLRQYESHDQVPQMAWLWKEDYVYRDGQLLAAERVPEEGGRRHFHLDHLGSPRLVTGQDSKEMSEHDFEPFGLESNPLWQETTGGFDREDPKRFTGHERDYAAPPDAPASAAYLDYVHARYYMPNVGRFLSIDPVSGLLARPQSWNKYAYVQNQPINFHDSSGAYRTDFHYDMTRIIAVAAGYSVADATTIAAMTELPDHDSRNPENAASYSARAAYHFPSHSRLEAMYVDASASHGYSEIGTYLHGLQDSFAHKGHGPLIGHIGPLLMGTLLEAVDSQFGAMGRGYSESYDVDTTSSRPGLAMDAARATYDALVKLNNGNARVPFSVISSSIQGYLSADEHSALRTFYANRLKKQLGIP